MYVASSSPFLLVNSLSSACPFARLHAAVHASVAGSNSIIPVLRPLVRTKAGAEGGAANNHAHGIMKMIRCISYVVGWCVKFAK